MNSRLEKLLAAESDHAERLEGSGSPDAPIPDGVKVTRGRPRARNLQVRFSDTEFADLAAFAERRGLPVSTVVRSLVLQAIAPADSLSSALDRLENDVAEVRRQLST